MDDETFPTESTGLPPSDHEVRARPAGRVRDAGFATLGGELLVRADEDAWDLFPSEGPRAADARQAASELVATPVLAAVSWEPPLEDESDPAEASASQAPVTAAERVAHGMLSGERRPSAAVLVGATGWVLFVGLFLLTRDPGPLPPAPRDEAPASPVQVATVAARAASDSRDPALAVRDTGLGVRGSDARSRDSGSSVRGPDSQGRDSGSGVQGSEGRSTREIERRAVPPAPAPAAAPVSTPATARRAGATTTSAPTASGAAQAQPDVRRTPAPPPPTAATATPAAAVVRPSPPPPADVPASPPPISTGDQVAAAVPLTPPPALPTPAAFAPAPAATPARPRSAAVQRVLDQYRDAFNALDPAAARAVWPAVDANALARAFDQLREQTVAFDDCRISVIGDRANATCSGTLRYVPRVGTRQSAVDRRRWEFALKEGEEGWSIERVVAR